MQKNQNYLDYAIMAIFVVLILLFLYLILRKAAANKKRKLIEKNKEHYNSLIFDNLMDGFYTRGLIPKTDKQKIAIEELLSHYAKLLDGEREKRRLNELAELYLADYYLGLLNSRKWSYRMNALYAIEDFRLTFLLDDVKSLLNKKRNSQQEIVHILRILASFQHNQLYDLLTQQFVYLSVYEYRNILIRLDKQHFDHFVLGFHKYHNPLQNAVIDVIAIKKEPGYHLFLEKVFFSCSNEVKLRALKAFAEFGYVSNIDSFLDLLSSAKWEERMISAKLFGALKESKGLPQLINLLHDNIWWVRSQAGQSISKFPDGKEILQRVYDTSKDPFARDMAWEWLNKGV